jgi:hypothetical protein
MNPLTLEVIPLNKAAYMLTANFIPRLDAKDNLAVKDSYPY